MQLARLVSGFQAGIAVLSRLLWTFQQIVDLTRQMSILLPYGNPPPHEGQLQMMMRLADRRLFCMPRTMNACPQQTIARMRLLLMFCDDHADNQLEISSLFSHDLYWQLLKIFLRKTKQAFCSLTITQCVFNQIRLLTTAGKIKFRNCWPCYHFH